MADATGTVTGDSTGVTTELAQAVAALASASVAISDSVNQLKSLLTTVQTATKSTTTSDDTNFETSVTGIYDPFDDLRRANVSRDRIAVYAEQALANAVEVSHRCALQGIDHNSIPPTAAKA